MATDLEDLVFPGDRSALKGLIGQARARRLLSAEGRETVAGLAASCAARIARFVDPGSPGARSGARVLSDHEVALHALTAAIDEVLDLEQALKARHQLGM